MRDCGAGGGSWRKAYNDYTGIKYTCVDWPLEHNGWAVGGFQETINAAGETETAAVVFLYNSKEPANGPYMSLRVAGITHGGTDVSFYGVNSLGILSDSRVVGTFIDNLDSGLFIFKGGDDLDGWEVITFPTAFTN